MHYTSFLLQVKWDVSPVIFHIGGFSLRYYSLLFGLAFLSSYTILSRVFTREKVPLEDLNSLTIYVFLGTLIGARLGQVFFYEFGYYSTHLLEIVLPFRIDKVKGLNLLVFKDWPVMEELSVFLLQSTFIAEGISTDFYGWQTGLPW